MTGLEAGALATSIVSLLGAGTALFVAVWGSKKDRLVGQANNAKLAIEADKMAIEAANNVRVQMEASLQKQTDRLDLELREYRAENRELREKFSHAREQWEQERRELTTIVHEFEKRALIAEGKVALAETRVNALEQRLADFQRPAA